MTGTLETFEVLVSDHENHDKSMFVKSIRDASGDVWESLGMFWSDPESSRMIPDDFPKS